MTPFTVRVTQGKLSLPNEVRQALNLQEGDQLLLTLEGNRVVLERESELLQELYKAVGQSQQSLASDELIQERRLEAALE
jgi:AbrB family looped-hinge helix DNA binding protein